MKILYICTYYHRAMIFRDLMDKLEEMGNTVLAFNSAAKGEGIADKYKDIMDEKVIHKECYTKLDRFLYFHKQNKIRRTLCANVDVTKYELIHSHMLFNGGWVALKLKEKFGVPYVVSVRNGDVNKFLRIPGFKLIAQRIVDEADGVLFLSECYRERFFNICYKNNYRRSVVYKKSVVIPNGVEQFWLDNIAQIKHNNKNNLKLLCVGKIDHNKNMTTVLKATELLNLKGISTSLTIIGQIVEQSINDVLSNNQYVEMVPYLTKEELIHYYKNCDIFVMPSFHETFGRVYVEAMTQGLPVIYTKGQGFDGFFADGSVGYSVNPDSAESIANAIEAILKDYSKISYNCINECQQFNWDEIAKKVESFYMSAVERIENEYDE